MIREIKYFFLWTYMFFYKYNEKILLACFAAIIVSKFVGR